MGFLVDLLIAFCKALVAAAVMFAAFGLVYAGNELIGMLVRFMYHLP